VRGLLGLLLVLVALVSAGCGGGKPGKGRTVIFTSAGNFPPETIVGSYSVHGCAADTRALVHEAHLYYLHSTVAPGPADLYYYDMRFAYAHFEADGCTNKVLGQALESHFTAKQQAFLLHNVASNLYRAFHAALGATAGGTTQPGITLDHRIGPVSFAEPKPEVTKALGSGVTARLSGHQVRFYPKVGIYVAYPPKPPTGKPTVAAFIVTRSSRYKTRSGVGVGSSLRELRGRVKVRCYGGSVCQHERTNVNLPFTVFNIDSRTKRITEIAIVPGGD
jgi:hypothetical protein